MSRAWADVRLGLLSPLVVVRRAQAAGAPYRAYKKLVAFQLVVTIAVLAAAAPFVVTGIRAVEKHDRAQQVTAHAARVAKTAAAKHHIEIKNDDEVGSVDADEEDDHDASQSFIANHAPALLPLWIALVSLYGAWIFIELAIGAVWKEHGEVLTDSLTRAAGIPVVTPPPPPPRIGLNLRWVAQKLWRQVLTAIMFASGAPFFLLAILVPNRGQWLYAIVVTLWAAYWVLVSTAAKADTAFRTPAQRMPWFLRAWSWLTTKVPGFRWFGPRKYGALWSRVTVNLHGAAVLFEERPYAFAGLAVMRVIGQVPLVSVVLRPILPVAAELLALRLPLHDAHEDLADAKSRSPEAT